MDRKLVDVGHRVEAQPGCGLIPDITHTIPGRGDGKIGADAKARDTVQASLRKAAAAVGNGILVGLCLAMGSRATTGAERDWRGFLGRRTRSGWWRLLRLE